MKVGRILLAVPGKYYANAGEIKNRFNAIIELLNRSEYSVQRGLSDSKAQLQHVTSYSAAYENLFQRLESVRIELQDIADELERRLKKKKIAGKTVTLKIKYSDFTVQTRSKTLQYFISDKSLIMEAVKDLLYQEKPKDSVRLLGISLANLNTEAGIKKTVAVQLKFDF